MFTPNLASMKKIISIDIVKLRGVAYCRLYTICREPMSGDYIQVSSDTYSSRVKVYTSNVILDEFRSTTNAISKPL